LNSKGFGFSKKFLEKAFEMIHQYISHIGEETNKETMKRGKSKINLDDVLTVIKNEFDSKELIESVKV
jgi:hypothetical protein